MLTVIVWMVLIALAVALLMAIINGTMSSAGNPAASSVFADMQNREKRNAMEMVIDMRAGERKDGQHSESP